MFQEFGPDARALLGVIAFFPQGVNENNPGWLFPTISNGTDILDGFCVLSLAYRINGFITMLAPLRDYLSPEDPKLSPLLCTAKERYFVRISVDIDPDTPSFGETEWITSEDVNVEHLLDVFTTIDDSDSIWDACSNFMRHLYWHKKRLTVLTPKIKGLPDGHYGKPECLIELSRLFYSVGNHMERKRLLTHALRLKREQGHDGGVAWALWQLSNANRLVDRKEGIRQMKEALEIYERLNSPLEQTQCLIDLARLLCEDGQFDAAEGAVSRAIDLIPENGNQFLVCRSHHLLGEIYRSKRRAREAVHHLEAALRIASSFNWHDALFRINYTLTMLSLDEDRLDDAHAYIKRQTVHSQ
jgi:hypothetical protein